MNYLQEIYYLMVIYIVILAMTTEEIENKILNDDVKIKI
jgi:hypothetical protein